MQLLFQVMFAMTEGINQNVLFAFSASFLSVVFSILSFCVDRDQMSQEMVAVNYYLALEREDDGLHGLSALESLSSLRGVVLQEKEKLSIGLYRGWRQKLSRSLTELWQIPDKSIEIGNTLTTSTGTMTHIVHLMKREDIVDAQQMFQFGGQEVGRYGLLIAEQFYASRKVAVSKIFRSHFRLGRNFRIMFYCRDERRRRTTHQNVASNASGSFDEVQNRMEMVLREYFESEQQGDVNADWMEMKRAEIMEMMERLTMDNVAVAGQHMTTPGGTMEVEMVEYNESMNGKASDGVHQGNGDGINSLEGMGSLSISKT